MDLFKKVKTPLGLRLKGYTFIGMHQHYETFAYYVRKIDEYNFDFAEVNYTVMPWFTLRLPKVGSLSFNRFAMTSGTTIKTLDIFMTEYLKRKEPITNNFYKEVVEIAGWNEAVSNYFSLEMPKFIEKHDEVKALQKSGWKILYVANTQRENTKKFGKVTILFVKEFEELSTVFKVLEFFTLPSFVKGEQTKEEYKLEMNTTISVPKTLLQ